MSIEQIAGWLASLVPALVVSWFTAWAYSRRETDRLVKVWEQERRSDLLNSVREHAHTIIQSVIVLEPLRDLDSRYDELWLAITDTLRASASILAIAGAMGDQQLLSASKSLADAALDAVTEQGETKPAVMTSASAILRRCEELVGEIGHNKPWWRRNQRAKPEE